MKCQNIFSGKNEKNILICRLLQILPRVISFKRIHHQINFSLEGFTPQSRRMHPVKYISFLYTAQTKLYIFVADNNLKQILTWKFYSLLEIFFTKIFSKKKKQLLHKHLLP